MTKEAIESYMKNLKRKTILVSIYYDDKEPTLPENLEYKIEDLLREANPDAAVFDVCIDETKPFLFNNVDSRLSVLLFKIFRK